MKTTLNLTLFNNGVYDDYKIDQGHGGFICGEFVEHFLNISRAPFKIAFTYADKNPKEKGFKKVIIKANTDDDGFPYSVFVSGKFYKNVSLFWALENRLPFGTEPTFWVKIEKLS